MARSRLGPAGRRSRAACRARANEASQGGSKVCQELGERLAGGGRFGMIPAMADQLRKQPAVSVLAVLDRAAAQARTRSQVLGRDLAAELAQQDE